MGGSWSCYVGPMVVCKASSEMVEVKDGMRCPTHGRLPAAAFCPECGIKTRPNMVSKKRPKVRPIDLEIFDDLQDVDQSGFDDLQDVDQSGFKDQQVYVPNRNNSGCRRPFHLESEGAAPTFTAAVDIGADEEWLLSNFTDALNTLREAYGASNVEIRWGAVERYS